MSLFGFLADPDFVRGVEEWKSTEKAVLLDVRTPGEYNRSHIPGSVNIPLDEIQTIVGKVAQKDTPLYVHCLSGTRSNRAVQLIQELGYTNVKNIGGIRGYRGEMETGQI